jgi:hypothetical protein
MGALRITDPNHFAKVSDVIAEDLALSAFLLELTQGLGGAVGEYHQALNRAGTFWHVTMHSHYVSCIIVLYRVFERDPGGQKISILNLMDTIAAWLADKTLCPQGSSLPWKSAVEQHYQTVDIHHDLRQAETIIERLARLRNSEIGHRSYKAYIKGQIDDDPSLLKYLQETIDLGFDLVERYSRFGLLQRKYPRILPDRDGYPFVLRAIARLNEQEPPSPE